jgi:hypothetical protein
MSKGQGYPLGIFLTKLAFDAISSSLGLKPHLFDAVTSRLMTSVHSKPPERIVEDNVRASLH